MKRIIITSSFLLLISTILMLSGCNQAKKAEAGAPQAAPEVPVFAVNTTVAVKGQIRNYLALAGDIASGTTVDTFSDVAGKITRLYVSIGQRVSRNQAIAEVDPSRPGMNYLPGIARAPIAGTIVALPAQVGMTISQSMSLAQIAGGNALELRVYVAERFISKIALRQPCEITLDAYPGELFRGSVAEVSPVVDPASRTMEVKINVENRNAQLKPGMFAKVKIITERKDQIVKLPAGALIQRFGKTYVFTAETDPTDPAFRVARQKEVVPGILVDGVAEIQAGLAADEEVIIRGQTLLEDGSRINVIDRVAPLSDTD
ncbi:MAG: efflux RND transporter periplasmic adaptor subunit [Treponema sp.]|jgi:multidrug efflux pump subunit AcrA (membrane-fusion protein)|nr:efflux RND transporter periplasmic adaptor subunit [Treponema sp.]